MRLTRQPESPLAMLRVVDCDQQAMPLRSVVMPKPISKKTALYEKDKKQRRSVCACSSDLYKKVHEVVWMITWMAMVSRRGLLVF